MRSSQESLDDTLPSTVPRFAFAVWCGGLAATLWFLHWIGTGDLATPPAPWRWGEWLRRVDPAAGVVALLRVGAVAASWYLVVITIVGAIGRRAGAAALVAVTDRGSPRFLRMLLGPARGLTASVLGLTVAVAPVLAQSAAWLPPGGQAAPRVGVVGTSPGTVSLVPATAVMRRVNPAISPGPPASSSRSIRLERHPVQGPVSIQPAATDDASAGSTASGAGIPTETWVVETGDHLWGIAAETLEERWGRTASEHEIARYWAALIDHNRSRLVAPSNPDLLHPGQIMELPTPT